MTRGFPPMQGGTLQSPARAVGGLPGNPGGNPASAAATEAGDNRWLDLMGRLFMRLGPNAGEAPATPGLRDMVMGSSSYYGHSPDAGPLRGMNRMTAWGESASTRFSGAEGKLSLDGEVDTAILGADGEWGRGVLSMRAGETGRFELALRSDAMLTDTASTADTGLERRCRCLAPKGRAAKR